MVRSLPFPRCTSRPDGEAGVPKGECAMNQWPSEYKSDSPVSDSRGPVVTSPASSDGDTEN